LNADDKQTANEFIDSECEKAGISKSRLLSSERKKELTVLRRYLALELKSKYSLTKDAIAGMLNLSANSVYRYFKTVKITSPEKIGPPSQQPPAKQPSLDIRKKDYFILDFSDHHDLYEHFLIYSEAKLRTPENQAIYLIMKHTNAWRKTQ